MKFKRGDAVLYKKKLYRVTMVHDDLVSLWNVKGYEDDVSADELTYVAKDTLSSRAGTEDTVWGAPKKKEPPKKKDSIDTGALISEEVQRLRREERKLVHNAPGAKKSVLEEMKDEEPMEMPKREPKLW